MVDFVTISYLNCPIIITSLTKFSIFTIFYREALLFLEKWRTKKDHKPLVIRDARRVGKTTLVDIFSKNFKQYISLNLELAEERRIFEGKQNFEEVTLPVGRVYTALKACPTYHDGALTTNI